LGISDAGNYRLCEAALHANSSNRNENMILTLFITEEEVEFTAVRAQEGDGQSVNKISSAILGG
jgi:protein subunit release factor B